MKPLEKDRAFQIQQLEQLQHVGLQTLQAAKEISLELESSINKIKNTIEQLPKEAKQSTLEDTADQIKAKLQTQQYDQCINQLKKLTDKLITDIPGNDQKLGNQLKELNTATDYIDKQINDLKDLIQTTSYNTNPKQLKENLENLQAEWEQTQGNIKTWLNCCLAH